jgi:hypothetical protein
MEVIRVMSKKELILNEIGVLNKSRYCQKFYEKPLWNRWKNKGNPPP